MYREIFNRDSINGYRAVLFMAILGIGVVGTWGCSNSKSSKRHNVICKAEQCEGADSDSSDLVQHGDLIKNDNGTDDSVCSLCKDYEVCLAGRCMCEPSCDGKLVKDDGCGGQCACPEGKVANEQLLCVDPLNCSGSCEVAGWECGDICGVPCGDCGSGHRCEMGHCECVPSCDGTCCDDGCGGLCPCAEGTECGINGACIPAEKCDDTCDAAQHQCGDICGDSCGLCGEKESCINHKCEVAVNCEECSLKLSLIDKVVDSGLIKSITMAVDYEPTETEPRPHMFDIRLKTSEGVSLTTAEVGDALLAAEKDLYTDPDTNRKWQERADGTYRFVAFSVDDNREIEKGRLMTLGFSANADSTVQFSLVEKQQIFAPPSADETLQLSSYARTIMVTQ